MSCPAGILIQKPPQKYSRLSDHVCTYGENLWRMRLRWHWWWQLLTLQGIACVYSFCAFVSQAGLSHQLLHLDCKIQTFDIWDQPELRQLKRFVFQRSTVASYERVVVAFGAVSWVWICSQVCRCDRTHSRGGWISSQALFFFFHWKHPAAEMTGWKYMLSDSNNCVYAFRHWHRLSCAVVFFFSLLLYYKLWCILQCVLAAGFSEEVTSVFSDSTTAAPALLFS